MTSIYRPKPNMGRQPMAQQPLTTPPTGVQEPYKPAPVAPGINFNPPQQPAAPMLPGQQAKPAVMPLGNSIVSPIQEQFEKYVTLPYRPDIQQTPQQEPNASMPVLNRSPLFGMPNDIPFGKPMPIPEKYATPYSPDDQGYMPNPGKGGYSPGAEPMPGRGFGRGGQRQMMQQMMRQMQMMQEMMRQQQMMRSMSRRNRGGSMNPFAEQLLGKNPMAGFGPNINNFQGPDVSGTMEEMPMVYKKGGAVKEKKMAMGGMGGPMDRMGLAPQPRQMPIPPKMAAANKAEAMGLLKGAIGAPGGTAGGTMQNALAALKGMKKGGKVEEAGMVGKEVAFMKKKGAPKSMVKHEEAEMKGYARGGGIESKGKTKGKMVKMAAGGMVGRASSRADGCAQRGKTKGKQVKMAGGGSC